MLSTISDKNEPSEWKVYFKDGFNVRHIGHDKPGTEIPVNKIFTWSGHTWHVPAVYSCEKGLVVGLFIEIDPAAIKAFFEKWDPSWEKRKALTREQEEQMNAEDPMRLDFDSKVTVNGRELRFRCGSSSSWIPRSCRGEGWDEYNTEALLIMEHYGLDAEMGGVFWWLSFPWDTVNRPKIKTLSVSLAQRPQTVSGISFYVRGVGDTISFTHPITGNTHTLKVLEYENQEADFSGFPADDREYPTHYTLMSYSVEPDLPPESFSVRDSGQGDSPRSKNQTNANGGTIIHVTNDDPDSQSVCSRLRFNAPKQIEWRMVFFQKTAEDIEIDLPC